ncbi:MAG: alpha-L-fucosidase [Akkermansiaceae bacterium]|nr:alpha-L-fucosidase [Akkermansiaceae bacterium]
MKAEAMDIARFSRRVGVVFFVAILMCLPVLADELAKEAEVNGDRTPSDAYGGNRKVEQPLTPDEARLPYRIPEKIAPGPFLADWSSFTGEKLEREPAWWREAKIGVWFHWGPQSMGRNGDWYARFLYQQPPEGRKGRANDRWMYDRHLELFGHPSEFGYMDVLNAWKAPKFDPQKLVKLYADSGARYILVQGAHHDNFDLWNSPHQPWNSVNVGPKRDIVGEIFQEARKFNFRTGMAFHADYSLWWFQPAFGSDKTGPRAGVLFDAATRAKKDGIGKWWEGLDPRDLYGIDLQAEVLPGQDIHDGFFTPVRDVFVHPETREFAKEYTLKWFRRVKQFVDDYDPDMLYTDGTEPFTGSGTAKGVISDATVKAVAHMYNKRAARNGGVVDCMAVIKGGPRIPGIAAPHENGYTGPIKREPWVWENTLGEWFFEDNTLYDSRAMIFQMIEAIARDGNFMLNIGLTPEGELEPGGVRMWEDFGEFTKRNALAIYGSSAWKILGEDGSEYSGVLGADVTARLREMISAHRLEFTVGVPVFGSDPAPGVPKLLKVSYRLDGQVGSMAKAENEAFVLAGVESLEILEARFVPDVSPILPRSFPSGPIIREHAEFEMSTKDVRFTHGKDGAVYVFVMAVPEAGERLRIRALGHSAGFLDRPVKSVSLLGSDSNLDWSHEPDALVLTYPRDSGFPFAVVFRVE